MEERISKRYRVYGIVQGVGFRPFVARIAAEAGIGGSVCNKGPYVEIFASGLPGQVEKFRSDLTGRAPERSAILKVEETALDDEMNTSGEQVFRIVESEKVKGDIFVSPDIATCDRCRRELFDPKDRRYLHPFINCTACGPRVTILDSMPYDRVRTSMGEFPMCPDCEYEYTHAETRRYHAQPVCCNDCGPRLYILEKDGSHSRTDSAALKRTREVIRQGGVAAIKGIGGFHLCCDATDQQAVQRLRSLKNRPFKPFATMLRDMDTVRRECIVNEEQTKILTGPKKPILLLEKRTDPGVRICPAAAPDNPNLGVMLPYAPVQMLLFNDPRDGGTGNMTDAFIMTSANPSGAPICKDDEDVLENISGFCDIVLSNNRKIRLRADDSVMAWQGWNGLGEGIDQRKDDESGSAEQGRPCMIRRSRGYAPLPVMLSEKNENPGHVQALGIGGELKNTFCLAKGPLLYPSPYIGDLSDLRSVDALEASVHRMKRLLEIDPQVICCDLHPAYNSTALARKLAEQWDVPFIQIQHHYAHMLSCMAEDDWSNPVIGVSFDGTGYGEDGSIWGGEFLIGDARGYRRAGALGHFSQAGGDLASREGWRVAASLVRSAFGDEEGAELCSSLGVCSSGEFRMINAMIQGRINTVRSTSAGRLFDGVSAILGLRRASTCEGEASMILQFAAQRASGEQSPDRPSPALTGPIPDARGENPHFEIPADDLIRFLVLSRIRGQGSAERLAFDFHLWMAEAILEGCRQCRRETGIAAVALTGGVMQNMLLLRLAAERLTEDGFRVLTHSQIPANDGGICVGQALYAENNPALQ